MTPASRSRILGLLIAILVTWGTPAQSADPDVGTTEQPLRFRRLLLPEELIPTWFPSYRPLKREAFESEIQRINERARRSAQISALTRRAVYRARLTGSEVLSGSAELEVVRTADEPGVLSLNPFNLAIGGLKWQADQSKPVSAGTTADQQFVALVERDGTLTFDWSLRGSASEMGERTFQVALPACAATHLILELPSDLVPILDTGILVPRPDATATPMPSEGAAPATKTWEFELGGHYEFSLRLVPLAPAVPEARMLLREVVRYRMTTSGLELRATFQLSAPKARIDQLRLQVTPGLHVASAQVGDRFLTLAHAPDGPRDASVQVILDEPLLGADIDLVVLAYAPLQMQGSWQLPRVRPEHTEWQEGQATLEILDPLALLGLNLRHGTETGIDPLPAPERGEVREVQFWEPEGTAEVQLGFPPQRIVGSLGSTVRFSELSSTARFVVDLTATQGSAFAIRGFVAPGWTVDSVQTEPADVLESFATRGGPRQEILIRLRRAISAEQSWRFIVRAHRRTPRLDQPMRADAVAVLEFPDVALTESLVALSAEPPLRMTVAGDETLQRMDVQQLSARQGERVGANAETQVLLDARSSDDWSLTLSREQPRFTARIEHTVEVDARQTTSTFEMRCEPNQSFVSRLLVHLSRGEPAPTQWELVDALESENSVTAKAISTHSDALGGSSWELNLSRPLNQPFTIRATLPVSHADQIPVTFASLPEATAQSGTLKVTSLGSGPLDLQVHNLQSIASPAADPHRLPTLRGLYRFAPSQEVSATVIRLPTPSPLAAGWIWQLHHESRFDAEGETLREARLHVENTGLATLDLELPVAASLVRVAVDHGNVQGLTLADGRLSIPLPKDRRFPLVSVVYRTTETRSGIASRVTAGTVRCSLPVLDRRCRLWLPPAYAALPDAQAPSTLRWDQRLFAVPVWTPEQRPFDPFAADDWRQLGLRFAGIAAPAHVMEPGTDEPPPTRGTVWAGVPPAVGVEEASCRWSAIAFPNDAEEPGTLQVYEANVLQAITAGLLLLAAGITGWLMRDLRIVVSCFLVFLAAVTLLVPEWLVPITRSLFLGTAIGWLWGWIPLARRKPVSVANGGSATPAGNSHSFVVATSLLLAILSMTAARLWGQEAAPAAPPLPRTFDVLSPVDEEQQPQGDYLFVPQELYDAIYRRANERYGSRYGAWLESSAFRVSMAQQEDDDARMLVRELTADYTLRCVQAGATFPIPLQRDRFRLVEATIGGQSIPVQWDRDNARLMVPLEVTGTHRLRLVVRPLTTNAEFASEFVVPVAPCSWSRLTVHAPGLLNRVEFPNAKGTVNRDEVAGEVAADLGPVSELRVRWTPPMPKSQVTVDSDVAELLWLHVQANSLVVHGKFTFSARGGSIGQVVMEVDRRLTLLPIGKDQPIAMVESEPGEHQRIRCWLDRPYQEVTLELSFAMNDDGGVGRWRLPRVQAQGTRRAPTWFGVTVTEGMQAEIAPESVTSKIAPSQFMMAWDEERDPPQQAFAATGDVEQWQLVVRPAPVKISLQEQQDVLIESERATFHYEAIVNAEQGRITRLNYYVPANFEPRDLVVLHDDANRLLRWSRVSDRELTVFLTVPLSGELRLVMDGSVRLPRGASPRLPLIAATNATPGPRRVNLYHADDLRVQVRDTAGLLADQRNVARSDWGRFVGSYSDSGSDILQPSLELSVQPNRPRVQGSIVTAMELEDDQWRSVTEIHLEVLSGTVDALRLQLPEEMSGRVQINPPVQQEPHRSPGERGSLLVARFPAAVDRELKLTITADLTFPASSPVRVPELRVLNVPGMDRFVVLPTQLQRQKALWEISGLQSADLPEVHSGMGAGDDRAVYRVFAPRGQAVLREVERVTGRPQVHLADYQLRWEHDGSVRGVASFYLEPSRLGEVEVAFPAGVRPLHFQAAGLPAAGRLTAEGIWRVPLGPELLPQLVELLFEGTLEQAVTATTVELAVPTITGIPVEQTVWTVHSPARESAGFPLLSHTLADSDEVEKIRRTVVESLRRTGLSSASRAHPEERDAWRAEWDLRLRQLETRQGADVSRDGNLSLARLTTPTDLAGQWALEAESFGPKFQSVLEGPAPELTVARPSATWRQAGRVLQTVLLLLGVLGSVWLSSRPRVVELWSRSPAFVFASGGLLWWLLLSPSVIGLVIMLLAVATAVRPRWKSFPA